MPTTRKSKQAKLEDVGVASDQDVDASKQRSPAKKKQRQPASKASKKDTAAADSDAEGADTAAAADAPKAGSKRKLKQSHGSEEDQGEAAAAAEAGSKEQQEPPGEGPLPDNTLEQGKVEFMFRHKVTTPGSEVDVSSIDDVQRLYILLQPQQPSGGKCRLLVVAKKRLPDTKRHERFYVFVEAVGDSLSDLKGGLGESTYSTKTRGERLQPAAQSAGEGTYVIAKGGSRNGIHLGFKLSRPGEPGAVQDMLGIKEEASFVLSAKNPANKGQGPPNVPSAGPDPDYSDEQREEFGSRAWIGVEDRSLLDVAGTELLLVGAKDDPIETGELGDAGKLLQQA